MKNFLFSHPISCLHDYFINTMDICRSHTALSVSHSPGYPCQCVILVSIMLCKSIIRINSSSIKCKYHTQLSCPHTSTDTGLFWFDSQVVLHLHNSSHVCGNTYIQRDQQRDKCFILKDEVLTRPEKAGWREQWVDSYTARWFKSHHGYSKDGVGSQHEFSQQIVNSYPVWGGLMSCGEKGKEGDGN